MPNGWWNLWGALSGCVAAYQPVGASSPRASYLNLANPGKYTAVPGTAPTFSPVNGWRFTAASSQYLTTGIVVSGDWSYVARIDSATAGDTWAFGEYSGAVPGWGLQPLETAQSVYWSGGNARATTGGSGVWGQSRKQGFFNGKLAVSVGGPLATASLGMFIGDISGIYRRYWSGTIQALALYNVTLTASAQFAIYQAVRRLPVLHPMDIMARYTPRAGGALTQFRKLLGLRTGSRGVSE